jgi:hypothetical protein
MSLFFGCTKQSEDKGKDQNTQGDYDKLPGVVVGEVEG